MRADRYSRSDEAKLTEIKQRKRRYAFVQAALKRGFGNRTDVRIETFPGKVILEDRVAQIPVATDVVFHYNV